jgi:hypothetical protein
MTEALLLELSGPDEILPLSALGPVLGGLRAVELSCFERLGQMACGAPGNVDGGADDAAASVWASQASLGHAWRASQLEELLPVSVGLPSVAECTRMPGPLTEEFVGTLARAVAPSWYRTLAQAYERRLAKLHPSADRYVARVLERLVEDVRWSEHCSVGTLFRPGRRA